jgi:thiamine kinase-like enzyme
MTSTGLYVAKRFFSDAPVLLSPAAQFELLSMLARERIGPAPVGFDTEERVLITRFVEAGSPASPDALGRTPLIERMASTLRSLHASRGSAPRFDPARYAGRYLEAAGGPESLTDHDRTRYEELSHLAAGFEREPACLCHNDLVADNVLVGARITLIDFDYAVSAPPILDLANFSEMNGFNADQTMALTSAYYGEDVPYSADEFASVRRLVQLLAHFWSLASARNGAAIVANYRMEDV